MPAEQGVASQAFFVPAWMQIQALRTPSLSCVRKAQGSSPCSHVQLPLLIFIVFGTPTITTSTMKGYHNGSSPTRAATVGRDAFRPADTLGQLK